TFPELPVPAVPGDPETPLDFVNRGQRLFISNPDDAIADFTEAIRLGPKFLPAYLARARAFTQFARFAEACEDFAIGLDLKGGGLGDWSWAVHAELAAGDLERYRDICRRIVNRVFPRIDENDVATRVLAAVVPLEAPDDALLASFDRLVGMLNPRAVGTQRLIAAVSFRQGRFEDALEQFAESAKRS